MHSTVYAKTEHTTPTSRPFTIPHTVPSGLKPISYHLKLQIERTPHSRRIPKSLSRKFSDKKVSTVLIKKYSISLATEQITNIIEQLKIGFFIS